MSEKKTGVFSKKLRFVKKINQYGKSSSSTIASGMLLLL